MRRLSIGAAILLLLMMSVAPAFAQQTNGSITGRVLDQQSAAVPGVTVTAKNTQTGLVRTEVSDGEGLYRLNALPVGTYDLTAELAGFTTVSQKGMVVSVGQTLTIDFSVRVAAVAETVNVTAATPLIETTASSVGVLVDPKRIESLPLNGRQFANLAATVPGVGLSFHSDPTKSTQYAPLVNGGAGRNINYQIDGGDNNDDTVGGLLQLFPLEAVQEFNFQTQRFKAEYGRSNGGVLSVVTKSGTNMWQGSAFEMFRDKSMNALTETERLPEINGTGSAVKGDYRQNQFGGSFGGPITKDKAHFFVAVERTQQDKTQRVNTSGLFPEKDGIFPVPYRENLFTGKVTSNLNANQYLAVRYARNNNSQPYGAAPNSSYDNWGDSTNKFNSINANHNWVLGGSKLNEFIFQYADFSNNIASRSSDPNETFPNGLTIGANGNTPQSTAQKKYQFRDDFSWHATGMAGLGHDFKAGVNFINEPRLFITFNTGKGAYFYNHLTNDKNGPISAVTLSDGDSSANIPMKQFATYIQDDWRVSDRLTVNLGLRYDLMTGYQFDESKNPNFVAVQAAGAAGKLANFAGLENAGLTPQEDHNNFQPRVGAVLDATGDGKNIVRGGWGVYTDVGYTNSNVLFAAADSTGNGFGQVFNVTEAAGIKNPNGTFFTVSQPISNIAGQNQVSAGAFPLFGQWVDPRLQQPYQMQANAGYSRELSANMVFGVDYVNSLGRDLNFRPRVNQRISGVTTRRLAAIIPEITPNTNGTRPAVSRGESRYDAMILSLRRRLSNGIDFSANYTLQRGVSTIGAAADELNTANIQDPNNPFNDPRQLGPNLTTDARHLISLSAVFEVKGGVRIAPIYFYRSALPVNLVDGRDLNLDGDAVDIPTKAYAVDGFDAEAAATEGGSVTNFTTFKEIGDCKTVNCARGFSQSQMNVRVSKVFHLGGRANVEAIGEVFNLFNAINPSGFRARAVIPSSGALDPNLLEPTTFSGDFRRPEQRVGQLGLRFSF
jgi:hypothetical protein